MRWFTWLRARAQEADVGEGFVLTEAAAHRDGLEAVLGRPAGSATALTVRFHSGPMGMVVASIRNHHAGFVPEPFAGPVRQQLAGLGRREHLQHSAEAFEHAGLWHLWVGEAPRPENPAVPRDALPPKPRRIGGIPLGER